MRRGRYSLTLDSGILLSRVLMGLYEELRRSMSLFSTYLPVSLVPLAEELTSFGVGGISEHWSTFFAKMIMEFTDYQSSDILQISIFSPAKNIFLYYSFYSTTLD